APNVKVDVGVKTSPNTVFAPPAWLGKPWKAPPATDGVASDLYVGEPGHAEIVVVVEYVLPTKLALAKTADTNTPTIPRNTRCIDMGNSTVLRSVVLKSLRFFGRPCDPDRIVRVRNLRPTTSY